MWKHEKGTESARKICIWSLDYSLEQKIVCPWGDNLLFAGKKAHKLSMIKHLGRAVSECFNSLFLVNLMNSLCILTSIWNFELITLYLSFWSPPWVEPFKCVIVNVWRVSRGSLLHPSGTGWAGVAPSRVAEPSRGEGTGTVQQPQGLVVSKSWPWGSCKDFCKGSALKSSKPGVFHLGCR